MSGGVNLAALSLGSPEGCRSNFSLDFGLVLYILLLIPSHCPFPPIFKIHTITIPEPFHSHLTLPLCHPRHLLRTISPLFPRRAKDTASYLQPSTVAFP